MTSLIDAARTVADATLWTEEEALRILKLSLIGIRAEDVIYPWKDHV